MIVFFCGVKTLHDNVSIHQFFVVLLVVMLLIIKKETKKKKQYTYVRSYTAIDCSGKLGTQAKNIKF